MSKLFSDLGKVFDVELRKSGIQKELKNGAHFLLVKDNEKVIGYVEYNVVCPNPLKRGIALLSPAGMKRSRVPVRL